jgi:hypothetical protein
MPPWKGTILTDGDRLRTGGLAFCWIVNVIGLPRASGAVTIMVPVRIALSGLVSMVTTMIPVLVPLAPEVMCNQGAPVSRTAAQAMLPPPVFVISNEVVVASKSTSKAGGVMVRTGGVAA